MAPFSQKLSRCGCSCCNLHKHMLQCILGSGQNISSNVSNNPTFYKCSPFLYHFFLILLHSLPYCCFDLWMLTQSYKYHIQHYVIDDFHKMCKSNEFHRLFLEHSISNTFLRILTLSSCSLLLLQAQQNKVIGTRFRSFNSKEANQRDLESFRVERTQFRVPFNF